MVLRSTAAVPTTLERYSSSGAYYSFLSSGSVTLDNALVKGMNASGLQLSGSAALAISSATFDNIGAAGGVYLTARALTSNATFYNVTFNDSPPAKSPVNVRVVGDDSLLRWYFASYSGSRSGDAYDDDPDQKVFWADT